MNIIQNPVVDARLRKWIAAHGPRVVSPMLGSEVHPVVIVDDIHDDHGEIPEEPVFELCEDIAAGGVGQVPFIQLINPTTSPHVVTIFGYTAKLGANTAIYLGHYDTVAGVTFDNGYGYSRRGLALAGSQARSTAELHFGTAPLIVAAAFFHIRNTPASILVQYNFIKPVVLDPGMGFVMTTKVDNGSLVGGFIWEETRSPR